MLILSRREDDTIFFPELNITIEILQVKGAKVRVGIDAPIEIKVLRGELTPNSEPEVTKEIRIDAAGVHEVRNRLNILSIAASLTKELLSQGKTNLAATTLNSALDGLAKPTNNSKATSNLTSRGPRALLIEDAANEREMLAGFLRLHGYVVDTVGDGVEALEFLAQNEKPDFMLVDMNLPRLDGGKVINKVRANPSFDTMEIFAVSGHTPRSAGVDVYKKRIAGWFQKPLKPAGLVASINQHVPARPSVAS